MTGCGKVNVISIIPGISQRLKDYRLLRGGLQLSSVPTLQRMVQNIWPSQSLWVWSKKG